MSDAPGGRRVFRTLAIGFVAEARSLDEHAWREMESIVAHAVAARSRRMQRQLALFVHVLDVVALARYGRRVASLDPPRVTALLQSLSRSRLVLLRRAVWGLRTLVFMGYYARPSAGVEIGYRAAREGWSARARGARS